MLTPGGVEQSIRDRETSDRRQASQERRDAVKERQFRELARVQAARREATTIALARCSASNSNSV